MRDKVNAFGDRLRTLRQAAGLTQVQLSRRSGLHRVYIAQLETGRRGRRPTVETVRRLAEALGVEVVALGW